MSMQVRDQARRFITLVDELYNARCVLVATAEVAPDELFTGAEGEEAILDLEGLQFETAVEDARLRRDSMTSGGVAPVASTPAAVAAAMGAMGGVEERFAFRRAVSRLYEMQSPQYILNALRMRQGPGGR
ncbi:putative ATPase N2B [Tetrabaena socialis]|uniref:Putative ATPase N2B n=1 Tax=Tetrabaena socialis TaxID=47790 RepID=A0A2J8ABE2_9CHLO|nr:putative ATPase N2B [Tetrabaena socialis]|eukprot:PNH09844.1 putative ATPase N2B [Tetrabaena socialis]